MADVPRKKRHSVCQATTQRSGRRREIAPVPGLQSASSNAHATRPTPADLRAARGKRVPDLIVPDLAVLFCGINPSLYSVAVGHHFARPGNRFWKSLHGAGFTPRVLRPDEEHELLELGLGITNVVPYATASAAELSRDAYQRGATQLARKLRRHRPRNVAFLGIDAYRIATGQRHARVGLQPTPFAGVAAWVLPNPSGLNAHYQIEALVREYALLARALARAARR
jgi:double-stranded uracil-DNA glycosylase